MKMRAGLKLKTKKPNKAPAVLNATMAEARSPVWKNQTPNAVITMVPNPPINPSNPSMRLTALTTTMYTNQENGALAQNGMCPSPKRPPKLSMRKSSAPTRYAPTAMCTNNLRLALMTTMSSLSPMKKTNMAAPKMPTHT